MFLSLIDRKSTRLNSSHVKISYAVLCLKKKSGRLEPAGSTQRAARAAALGSSPGAGGGPEARTRAAAAPMAMPPRTVSEPSSMRRPAARAAVPAPPSPPAYRVGGAAGAPLLVAAAAATAHAAGGVALTPQPGDLRRLRLPPLLAPAFFFFRLGDHRDLHSFPPRRSSD